MCRNDQQWKRSLGNACRIREENMEKRPFIIDCDTGTDDAIAILAALGSDAIRVRALTLSLIHIWKFVIK